MPSQQSRKRRRFFSLKASPSTLQTQQLIGFQAIVCLMYHQKCSFAHRIDHIIMTRRIATKIMIRVPRLYGPRLSYILLWITAPYSGGMRDPREKI